MKQDGELQGVSLPEPGREEKQRYLMEADDGMLASVPEDLLGAWSASQRDPAPLTRAGRRLKDRIVRDLYGSKA